MIRRLALSAAFLAIASTAQAQPLTTFRVFLDADEINQTIMLVLVICSFAAIAVAIVKIAAGRRLTGGSAFIRGLRLSGPLLGLLGASHCMLHGFLAIANTSYDVTLKIMAPGIAESIVLFGLGILAGSIAVVANWIIEAVIDRTVLAA